MLSGVVTFLQPNQRESVYAVIDPQKANKQEGVFLWFGIEDSVYNHTKLAKDLLVVNSGHLEKHGENLLNIRKFTVQTVRHSEVLTLSFHKLDRMKSDF